MPSQEQQVNMAELRRAYLKRKAAAALILLELWEEEEDGKRKRGKTRNWIRRREKFGYFTTIVEELRVEDTPTYKEMMRMEHSQVIEVLLLIEILYQKIYESFHVLLPKPFDG